MPILIVHSSESPPGIAQRAKSSRVPKGFSADNLNGQDFRFQGDHLNQLRQLLGSRGLIGSRLDRIIVEIERQVRGAYATSPRVAKPSDEVRAARALAKRAADLANDVRSAPERIVTHGFEPGENFRLHWTLPPQLREYAAIVERYADRLERGEGRINLRKPRVELASGLARALSSMKPAVTSGGWFYRLIVLVILSKEGRKPTKNIAEHLVRDAISKPRPRKSRKK